MQEDFLTDSCQVFVGIGYESFVGISAASLATMDGNRLIMLFSYSLPESTGPIPRPERGYQGPDALFRMGRQRFVHAARRAGVKQGAV